MNSNWLNGMVIGLGAILMAAAMPTVEASGDEEHHHREGKRGRNTPLDPVYVKECGSCHLPYAPGLLSDATWQRVMAGLADHFGENAELPEGDRAHIARLLSAHADGRTTSGRETSLRISQLPWFTREHRQIPARLAPGGNPRITSWSACQECHPRAASDSYAEREIRLPGGGKWQE